MLCNGTYGSGCRAVEETYNSFTGRVYLVRLTETAITYSQRTMGMDFSRKAGCVASSSGDVMDI